MEYHQTIRNIGLIMCDRTQGVMDIGNSDSHSAGNLDPLCVHPAMILRQQRGNHRPDVVGLAWSAKRGHSGNSLGNIRIIAHDTPAEIGCNSAGRNAVHGDASLAQLERHIFGHRFDSSLHRGVGGAVRHDDPRQAR